MLGDAPTLGAAACEIVGEQGIVEPHAERDRTAWGGHRRLAFAVGWQHVRGDQLVEFLRGERSAAVLLVHPLELGLRAEYHALVGELLLDDVAGARRLGDRQLDDLLQ